MNFEYDFKINDISFTNIEGIGECENLYRLEWLLNIAPIFYLSNSNQNIENVLPYYSCLAMEGINIIHNYELITEYKKDDAVENECTSKLVDFNKLLIDIASEQFSEDSIKKFFNNIKDFDTTFSNKKIEDSVLTIIGHIALFYKRNKDIRENDFIDTVERKYKHILSIFDKKKDYENVLCLEKKIDKKLAVFNCFAFILEPNNGIQYLSSVKKYRVALTDIVNELSKCICEKHMGTLKNMISEYNSLSSDVVFSSFRKNQYRCFAIIIANGRNYFSFSGVKDADSNGIIKDEAIRSFADEINKKLFDNTAFYCYLSGNTKNYIEIVNKEKRLRKNPMLYKDDIPSNTKFYSCCERKIMGMFPHLRNYDLYVFFSPCFKCIPDLKENKSINAFITYNQENSKFNFDNVHDFSPKRYKIINGKPFDKLEEIH